MKSTSFSPEMPQKFPTPCQQLACFGGLFAFGMVYNYVSQLVLRSDWGESKSSLFVVMGVAITVTAMMPLIGWRAVRWLFWGFLASGTPMVFGQFHRHSRNIRRARARLLNTSG